MKKSFFNLDKSGDKSTGSIAEEQKPVMTSDEENAIRSGKKSVKTESIDEKHDDYSDDDETTAKWRTSCDDRFYGFLSALKELHKSHPGLTQNEDWLKGYEMMKKGFDELVSGPVSKEQACTCGGKGCDECMGGDGPEKEEMEPTVFVAGLKKIRDNTPETFTNSEEKLKMFNDAKPRLEAMLEEVTAFLDGKGPKPSQKKMLEELKLLFSYMKR